MNFLQNCWYAAALANELADAPLGRTLLGEPIALYRLRSGEPVALTDICPHRFAPLSKGQVVEDAIRCPYHGLRFGHDGKCTHNPLGAGVLPAAAKVRSYPIREVDGILWIWFGDEKPDFTTLPRFEEFGKPDEWTCVEGYIPVKSHFLLVSDNLLDLSHAEFLHPDLATPGFNRRVKVTVERDGDAIVAVNRRPSEPISNAFRLSMGGDEAPDFVDRVSTVRWEAPANLSLIFDAFPAGQTTERVRTVQAHLITPETETSCHYFFKIARDHLLDNAGVSERIFALADHAFRSEDAPMIEAQQRRIGEGGFDAMGPVLLKSDEAATRARRIFAEKLDAQTENESRVNIGRI
ncbi:aromatic ring-hydroxylating dioxygenase subunit alpha [Sphingopyxis sp.]|uniref:aromatic ring-hydroxylating dioxygenase subunit alpha n=1 Tax=Sphingopyxis sp. TaxID=1908224 RepID=UPI002B47ECB7|nr:aromatic ring-hydroxylating dioxygenase subunit alpha [Sphingopyxis sp.]HJS09769.1 aromatic ring-hydroxylating dioxygenase subunit alpha [Sphingopyxis sp.]